MGCVGCPSLHCLFVLCSVLSLYCDLCTVISPRARVKAQSTILAGCSNRLRVKSQGDAERSPDTCPFAKPAQDQITAL